MRRVTHRLVVGALVFSLANKAGAQQKDVDRSFIASLTAEVIGLALLSGSDTTARQLLGEAANLQLELEDFDGFLSTARTVSRMPRTRSQYRQMSRNLVCYLLEDRRIEDARRFAFALADHASDDLEEADWTRAHFARQLLRLPQPLRDSLKSRLVDSATLNRQAFAIARSIKTSEVTTDMELTLVAFHLRSRDSAEAHRALKAAYAASRFIENADRRRSRSAMMMHKAMALGDASLAEQLAGELWEWEYFGSLVSIPADSSRGRVERPTIDALRRKILLHHVDLLKRNPDQRVRAYGFSQLRFRLEHAGRKALADSLMLPVEPKRPSEDLLAPSNPKYEELFYRASESIRKRNVADAERLLRAIPDPEHKGLVARAMINLSSHAHPDDSLILRQRGLTLLLKKSKLEPRDEVLSELAVERLMSWGDNEMAIDLVNEVHDVKKARAAIADIGQSTLANLNASKLRKLVERIRSPEVKDQVLFRLMISMLLTRQATPAERTWGLALADSIKTPDLRTRAKFEKAKSFWFNGDSARARKLLLELLPNSEEHLTEYDRYSIVPFLVAARAQDELLAWARSKRHPRDRARALLQVIYPLRTKLPSSPNPRRFVISNGPDGCRDDF